MFLQNCFCHRCQLLLPMIDFYVSKRMKRQLFRTWFSLCGIAPFCFSKLEVCWQLFTVENTVSLKLSNSTTFTNVLTLFNADLFDRSVARGRISVDRKRWQEEEEKRVAERDTHQCLLSIFLSQFEHILDPAWKCCSSALRQVTTIITFYSYRRRETIKGWRLL